MDAKQTKQLVKNIYHDIWQGKDLNKFSTYYHPDVTAYMDEQIIDYTQIQEHALWQQENLKEIIFDFKDIIVEENKVAFHFQSSGLQDNRDIGYKVLAIYHLKDNKVFRIYAQITPKIDFKKEI